MATDARKPDLILGIVDNYTSYELAPFIRTLRDTDFDGHLCLLAGPRTSVGARAFLVRHGAEVIRYDDGFPFISSPHPENIQALPHPIHIYNFRHFLYLDYLLKHPGRFRNVLITDVRDVFFQRSPFDLVVADKIHVAMENPSISLGECEWNRGWLRAGFGDQAVAALADEQISCAGTTLAPADQMIRYLTTLLARICEMDDAMNCADQAAHNLLLHEGRLNPIERLQNFRGPILTLGNETSYRLNDRNELINEDGSVINIVHQYDRHPVLQRIADHRTARSRRQERNHTQ
jgi:hypothetical protein